MKKCDLELLQWYNIDYKDRTPSRKYSGPGLYVGYCEYEKAYQFYIPCNLHVLRGDQARYMKKRVFPSVCLFTLNSIKSVYTGDTPKDYYELQSELNRK